MYFVIYKTHQQPMGKTKTENIQTQECTKCENTCILSSVLFLTPQSTTQDVFI